jgi:hypothetical protein
VTSHVEQAIAARIARVRAQREQRAQERRDRAVRRAYGLHARYAGKLRHLAEREAGTRMVSTRSAEAEQPTEARHTMTPPGGDVCSGYAKGFGTTETLPGVAA